MPLGIKTFTDLSRIIFGKFTQALPEVDPTITPSLANANSVGSAIAGVGLQDGIQDAVDQMFWQTADDDYLGLIGSYDKVNRNAATNATGFCCVEGVLTTSVPLNTQLIYNGNTYLTLSGTTVQTYTGSCSLSFSANVVTAVTPTSHNLATGLTVTISGAIPSTYNGSYLITVIDDVTFQYDLTSGALASSSATFSDNYALLNIQSVNTGDLQNIDAGGVLSINITNLSTNAYVTADRITGGADIESIDDYRIRIGEAHNLTPGIATVPTEVYSAKKISGNTRVYVIRPQVDTGGNPITGGVFNTAGYLPLPGQTVIYILRDNDTNIIPSPTILTNTKNQILSDGIWPTFLPDSYLMVLSPDLIEQDFTFSNIVPNTTTMKTAITNQLKTFFSDNTTASGQTITLAQIQAFMYTIQDFSTGQFLESFTIVSPVTSIVAGSGEIITTGTITYV